MSMHSEKITNSFYTKKNIPHVYWTIFFKFVDNFSALLLCEINIRKILNTVDFLFFFQIRAKSHV